MPGLLAEALDCREVGNRPRSVGRFEDALRGTIALTQKEPRPQITERRLMVPKGDVRQRARRRRGCASAFFGQPCN